MVLETVGIIQPASIIGISLPKIVDCNSLRACQLCYLAQSELP